MQLTRTYANSRQCTIEEPGENPKPYNTSLTFEELWETAKSVSVELGNYDALYHALTGNDRDAARRTVQAITAGKKTNEELDLHWATARANVMQAGKYRIADSYIRAYTWERIS